MANVFGDLGTPIGRARLALSKKYTDMKDIQARTYVENLKKQWGTGVCTLCLVYNATGNTITYVGSKDWFGHIGPGPYPKEIQNGQWGAFLHVKGTGAASGSNAAVVYRGKNQTGEKDCDYMMAWSTPWRRTAYDNSVWTEAREVNHFTETIWNILLEKLDETRSSYRDTWEGCLSTISIDSGTSPMVEATFTLEDAEKP